MSGFIYSVVIVTEYIVALGTGTCDRPEACKPVQQWPQSCRVARWLEKKKNTGAKLLSPWKLGSQVEASGSPSIVKTYKTDLIYAWLYYHSVSVRSLVSLRSQGHAACVSQLCSSSLTAEQVWTQMEPTGDFSTAGWLDQAATEGIMQQNLLKPRWIPPDDLTAVIYKHKHKKA